MVARGYLRMPVDLRTGRSEAGRSRPPESESCQTGTRAQSGSQTRMLTVDCGQSGRSAASLDLDCFIAATATLPGRTRGRPVGGRSVLTDPAVGRASQGDEQRGTEGLAIRRGVGLAHRPRADLATGQVRGVLAAASQGGAATRRRRPGASARPPALGDPGRTRARPHARPPQDQSGLYARNPTRQARRFIRVGRWSRCRRRAGPPR
jgi:hypothetical protein